MDKNKELEGIKQMRQSALQKRYNALHEKLRTLTISGDLYAHQDQYTIDNITNELIRLVEELGVKGEE